MHTQLLSDREREMLTEYLKNGKKSNGLRLVKLRILRNYEAITKDYELMSKAKEAFKANQSY
jgi:hypothetical protein